MQIIDRGAYVWSSWEFLGIALYTDFYAWNSQECSRILLFLTKARILGNFWEWFYRVWVHKLLSNLVPGPFPWLKLDSAFRVSGVLQLAKTGPLAAKNFPLLRLFLSAAMMVRTFYTACDVNCTNWHILIARGMSHIFTGIGQLRSKKKKLVRACPKPKLEKDESSDHRLE